MSAPQESTTAPAATATDGAHRRTTVRRWLTRSTIATGVAVTFVVGGTALAAWNVTGAGSGSAGAASAEALEAVTVTIATSLYPGLTTDATLAVTNPNPFPVRLLDIEFGTVTVSDAAGCDATNSQVTFTDITGVTDATYFIAADASESFLLADVVTMGTGASDLCQSASFSVDVELNAESTTTP
jgi:hypothetical protein